MLTEQILVKRAEKSLFELEAVILDYTAPEQLRKDAKQVFELLMDDLTDPRLSKSVDPKTLSFIKSYRSAMLEK